MDLPDDLFALLRTPALCYVGTLMPDGSPQLTQTWVDTDGTHLIINIVDGMQKARNLRRDPRVTVAVSDPSQLWAYTQIRGRVVSMTSEGGAASIDAIARKYIGRDYQWQLAGQSQTRLVVRIAADRVTSIP